MPVPNKAQQEIQGRLTRAENIARKIIEINKFSSLGKNKETAVMQITQALGLTN